MSWQCADRQTKKKKEKVKTRQTLCDLEAVTKSGWNKEKHFHLFCLDLTLVPYLQISKHNLSNSHVQIVSVFHSQHSNWTKTTSNTGIILKREPSHLPPPKNAFSTHASCQRCKYIFFFKFKSLSKSNPK